ncbi:hypothetical protein ACUXV3_01165 [Roseobacteraceae bacterium NS-SX3]
MPISSDQARSALSRFKHSVSQALAPRSPRAAARPRPAAVSPARRQAGELTIPAVEESAAAAARRALQDQGQFLARQDRWDCLLTAIRRADAEPPVAPGAVPAADLLAYGARADVVNAVEHALSDGPAAEGRQLIEGVMGLEAVRCGHRDDPHMAALLAMAHIDIGWAWRGPRSAPAVPALNRRRCAAHFGRAAALLTPHDTTVPDSRFLAAAQCALLSGRRETAVTVAGRYARLVALDPGNHRPMRALGTHMLPRWFGSCRALETEARRTAAQTEATWGAGGYAWVYFDALAMDETACAHVDTRFFIQGLEDIVRICPDQEMINLLAAYCTVALRADTGACPQADRVRLEIAGAAEWLIRGHLRELHPMIWAHAAEGFDNSARITSARRFAARGRADAVDALKTLFHDEIAGGGHVMFSPEGLQLQPG